MVSNPRCFKTAIFWGRAKFRVNKNRMRQFDTCSSSLPLSESLDQSTMALWPQKPDFPSTWLNALASYVTRPSQSKLHPPKRCGFWSPFQPQRIDGRPLPSHSNLIHLPYTPKKFSPTTSEESSELYTPGARRGVRNSTVFKYDNMPGTLDSNALVLGCLNPAESVNPPPSCTVTSPQG